MPLSNSHFIKPIFIKITSYFNEFKEILFISLKRLSTPISSGSNASTVLSTCLNVFLNVPSELIVYISTKDSVGNAK